jgi:hypothetical protein
MLDEVPAGMWTVDDFIESTLFQDAFKKSRDAELNAAAAKLTAADVLAEVAKWGDQASEKAVTDFVGLIARKPGQAGWTLYKTLSEAVPSEDLKTVVDQQWSRVRPNEPDIGTKTGSVKYEFDDYDELMAAMNEICAVMRRGGKREFVFWDGDGYPVFGSKRDAEIALAQYRFHKKEKKKNNNGKEIWVSKEYSGFAAWLKSPLRREYFGVGFFPDVSKCPKGYLNLWAGFAVEPEPGDWSLMRTHILDNVCQGNAEQFDFYMDWLSQLMCEPGRKSGVITAIRGLPGTGKSKVGEWVCQIIGPRYSMVIEKGKHITGHFNGHLEYKIFVLAEEAVFAGDPLAAKALKHLGTSKDFTYENKGCDARDGLNYTRVQMSTNDDWMAPVESTDRRYFVTDCSASHKEDKPYFAAIDKQMEDGGAAAMLHELLERGMTFEKLGKPPMTDAKRDQMRHSMSPQLQWLASVLTDGEFAYKEQGAMASEEWPVNGGPVRKAVMLASYQAAVPGYRGPASAESFGIFVKKHLNNPKTTKRSEFPGGKRVPHYDLLSLKEAREEFIRMNPGYVFDEVEDVPDAPAKAPANDAECSADLKTG